MWSKRTFWIVSIVLTLGISVVAGKYVTERLLANDDSSIDTGEGDLLDKRAEGVKDKEKPVEWSEAKVISTMHKMTHQKVRAAEKWGSVEMTDTRIREVKEIIRESNRFENKDLLLSMIEKWEIGDFSKVDKDHNELWKLQDGTIGKATGILSRDDEQKFIENTFD